MLQPSVSGVSVSLLVSGLTVDILRTFCSVFMVLCVKLMLIIFEFGVLLFDCFVHRQNVTCLKHFTRSVCRRGGRHNHRQTRSCLLSRFAKNYSVQLWFDDAMLKSDWFCFIVDTLPASAQAKVLVLERYSMVQQCLMSHSTHYRSFRRRFYGSHDPTNSVIALKDDGSQQGQGPISPGSAH